MGELARMTPAGSIEIPDLTLTGPTVCNYGKMSSTEFINLVRSSDSPIALLDAMHGELGQALVYTVRVLELAKGEGDAGAFYDYITEATEAPARAKTRKDKKEELATTHMAADDNDGLVKTQSLIDQEYELERSFRTYLSNSTGSNITRSRQDQATASIIEGSSLHFPKIGKVTDRGQFEQSVAALKGELAFLAQSLRPRKAAPHFEAACVHAYNAFSRLDKLETAISKNPAASGIVARLSVAIRGFQEIVLADVRSFADLSPQLRRIIDAEREERRWEKAREDANRASEQRRRDNPHEYYSW